MKTRSKHIFLISLLFIISIMDTETAVLAQNSSIVKSEFIFNEAPFKECHASTIESTPDGLVASWFGGTKERNEDVEIWVSREKEGVWSTPVSVADGVQHKDKRYPTWNPVLFLVPGGPLMLFYKVGPNPREWWGMLKISEDGGRSWSEGCRLPEDILGPIKNKPVLIDQTLICPSSTENDGWRIHMELTRDMGKTWEIIGPVNEREPYHVIQPTILNYGKDTLQLLARSKESKIMSSWSYDGGMIWGELKATELPNPNSGIDAVTLDNGYQLLVYNHSVRETENIGNSRTPLNVAISVDGESWKNVITLEDEPGEYSYPAVIQSEDGMVHITYTWNRKKIKYVMLDPKKL